MKKTILPDKIFGTEVKGAMERVLSGNTSQVQENSLSSPVDPTFSIN